MESAGCKRVLAVLPSPIVGQRTHTAQGGGNFRRRSILFGFLVFLTAISTLHLSSYLFRLETRSVAVPLDAESIIAKCRSLNVKPGPPADFHSRSQSDRYQHGTEAVLIRNATIWTGESNGKEVLHGDVFLDGGLIKMIGNVLGKVLTPHDDVLVVEADGAWLTPGIVDMHSHLGGSSPNLRGSDDGNSWKGPITPWLRILDALNTHDLGYESSISGGVTTSLIIQGSLNAIGGQGLVMKLRQTKERSPTSMLLEPYLGFNGSDHSPEAARHWGHMKHACGENPKSYGDTRMDSVWLTRQAYDTARTLKVAQDDYCQKALSGDWSTLRTQKFPENLQWQPLVDVLRGKIKVQTHCYEAVDIDNFVRLSNEFKFEVTAFHHAHEAWLVPDVLKRAYGKKPPALAMFSTFARYKREAYLHSEFAPRVLADEGFDVVMKSDHSAIPSRNLLAEAAIAHYWGLADNIALLSVTGTPARILGLDHRVGFIKEGYDADLVLWDSHPLSLGATPTQVIIDGILQIPDPYNAPKPVAHQRAPSSPNWDRETAEALKYNGLPPLEPTNHKKLVVFTNVSSFWSYTATAEDITDLFAQYDQAESERGGMVVVQDGSVICFGRGPSCNKHKHFASPGTETIDLHGGAIQPGLVAYGSALGLTEIEAEASTSDGFVKDPLDGQPPLFGAGGYVAKAVDGLQFGTRDALLAYRAGVTVSVSSPSHQSWLSGLSTALSLGSAHKHERGAVVRDIVAVHTSLAHGDSNLSVSTKIAAMRRLLTKDVGGELGEWFSKVANGTLSLVVNVASADIIATLVSLKQEVEAKTGVTLKLTIAGATEAHLMADELAKANVGVIVTPTRPYPYTWDERRTLPGPPLSADSLIGYLIKRGVTVGVGPRGVTSVGHPGAQEMANSRARNLRFDVGEAMLDAGPDTVEKGRAFALATVNIAKLLGLEYDRGLQDLVATAGGDLLDYEGKVIAIISPRREVVDIF